MAALVGSGDEEDVADLEMSTLAAALRKAVRRASKGKTLQLDVADAVQHQPELEALELGALGLHLGWLKTTPSWRDFLLECALNQRWATKVCGGGCSFCPRTWRM